MSRLRVKNFIRNNTSNYSLFIQIVLAKKNKKKTHIQLVSLIEYIQGELDLSFRLSMQNTT